MAERKFTPPTEFPAEYVDEEGNKIVVLGRYNNGVCLLIGFNERGQAISWTQDGKSAERSPDKRDLHDTPKRITTWHNVHMDGVSSAYPNRKDADYWQAPARLCVYRIERDEDGGNSEIFVEKQND